MSPTSPRLAETAAALLPRTPSTSHVKFLSSPRVGTPGTTSCASPRGLSPASFPRRCHSATALPGPPLAMAARSGTACSLTATPGRGAVRRQRSGSPELTTMSTTAAAAAPLAETLPPRLPPNTARAASPRAPPMPPRRDGLAATPRTARQSSASAGARFAAACTAARAVAASRSAESPSACAPSVCATPAKTRSSSPSSTPSAATPCAPPHASPTANAVAIAAPAPCAPVVASAAWPLGQGRKLTASVSSPRVLRPLAPSSSRQRVVASDASVFAAAVAATSPRLPDPADIPRLPGVAARSPRVSCAEVFDNSRVSRIRSLSQGPSAGVPPARGLTKETAASVTALRLESGSSSSSGGARRGSVVAAKPSAAEGARTGCSVSSHASTEDSPVPLRFFAGTYTVQGQKPNMPKWVNQDRSLVLSIGRGRLFVGVFDGHGTNGQRASERAKGLFEAWAPALASMPRGQLPAELSRCFREAHETLQREGLAHFAGTTATVALLDAAAGVMTVAHVGDSTLLVASGTEVEFSTREHRVDAETERRVLARGGEVRTTRGAAYPQDGPTRRICGRGTELPGLAMARSLGDAQAHALGALCEPDISSVPLDSGALVVLASDGVWDVTPARDVADFLAAAPGDATHMARGLAARARARWPLGHDIDDITAVVVQAMPATLAVEAAALGA
eukprot:TRINITY_DN4356_c0_g2_i3.p1 TRINITY_DN4356_c0_g2~~TRINITY_DN4356_c0_g2_i3.p1  ORF type:complete len:719 (-),score=121.16 TRINITY_DN4356_c0_g2_i3:1928-3973(-)